MKNIQVTKISALIKLQLKARKKEIVGWSTAVCCITLLYTVLFPTVKDMAQVKMEAMPKELLQLVGMDRFADMGNYIAYFGMIFGLILVAVCVFAVVFASRILLDEERSQSIEFLAAQEVSRVEIYLAKFLTAFLAVLLVVCLSAIAALVSGLTSGRDSFNFMEYASIIKVSSITPFFFMAVSFALAGFSSKYGNAMTGSFLLMLSYMLGYLSKLLGNSGKWLRHLSPFETLSATNAANLDSTTLLWCGLYLLMAAALVVAGGYAYRNRDYA